MFTTNSFLLLNKLKKPFSVFIRTKKSWWYPDPDYIKQFQGAVMYPDETTSKWKPFPYSGIIHPKEMKIKNLVINFGCAHPAAHGLLRLVLQLDGEVSNNK